MVETEERIRVVQDELIDCRQNEALAHQEKGGLQARLEEIQQRGEAFKDFVDDLERAAVAELERETHRLHQLIMDGQAETREKAEQKVTFFADQVRQRESTLKNFDHLVVTRLRKRFQDSELDRIFSVLNFDLLELPISKTGAQLLDEGELARRLDQLLAHTTSEGYSDSQVEIRFRALRRSVSELENPQVIQEQLREYQGNWERWRKVLQAIQEREHLQSDLTTKRETLEAKRRELVRWEEYLKSKAEEPRLLAELDKVQAALAQGVERIRKLESQLVEMQEGCRGARNRILKAENDFNGVMGQFNQCRFPDSSAKPVEVEDIPKDFGAAIAVYIRLQDREQGLDREVTDGLRFLETHLGDEFLGNDDADTISGLASELEALSDKEDALARDWNAHIHELKGAFDHVLKELGEVRTAADQLNRQFSRIQVSNLKTLRIEAKEQSDVVSRIRRLAESEQPGLFDADPALESTLKTFRERLQANPLIRFGDLFTLEFVVVGDDDMTRHYQEFRQIESHGTTITIKVLFNLLILKSLLRKDDSSVPFFLDEIQALDPANRHAILSTARKLGFVAITAAPESITEVDALYFLQPHKGRVVLRHKHRLTIRPSVSLSP